MNVHQNDALKENGEIEGNVVVMQSKELTQTNHLQLQ